MNHDLPLRSLLLYAALFISLSAQAPLRAQPKHAELDSVLATLHDDDLFTGVLLIGHAGEPIYTNALGTYQGQPITVHTPMHLMSVTKPLTATAILSLAEEGTLDLDAPVDRYLPSWPYPQITLRHLLNQTSGLHFLTTINEHADTTRPVTNDDVLALIAEHQPAPAFEPGSAFRYDNANYVTLGAVLEAVTGHPYADVIRDYVLEPAGMDDAYVAPGTAADVSWLQWLGGDGVHASVTDLLAFDHAFHTGDLIAPDLVQDALTGPTLPDGTASRYGFGWFTYEDPAPMVGHFGDGATTKTALMHQFNTETTFALLMPGDAIHRTAILQAVIQLWNGKPYTLPSKRPVADVPQRVLERYIGVYDSGMGRLHITLEDGGLHLEPEGAGGSEPLIPASETVFYFGHQDLSWEFVVDASGEVTGLMLQDHPETLGKKVE
jgi:CubicO group peptidase (beta-lactamase class C family)